MDHSPAPDSPASSPKSVRVPAEAIRQFFGGHELRELAEQSGTESLREGLELLLALLLQPDPPPLNPTEVELVWRVIESDAPDGQRALMLRDAAAAFAGRKSRIGPLYFEVPVLLLKKACLLHFSMLMEAELLSMVIYSGLAKAELSASSARPSSATTAPPACLEAPWLLGWQATPLRGSPCSWPDRPVRLPGG